MATSRRLVLSSAAAAALAVGLTALPAGATPSVQAPTNPASGRTELTSGALSPTGFQADLDRSIQELLASNPGALDPATGVGASRTGQAAIAWAMQYVGGGGRYQGLCLTFVDDAFAPGGGRVGTAIEQWQRAAAAGYGHPGDRNPPVGAHVFWQTSNPANHIAIYVGDGMVLTTEAAGGQVGVIPMSQVDTWGPYIGWASPYYA